MGKQGNVVACLKCPKDVSKELWRYVANKKNVGTSATVANRDFDFSPIGYDKSEDEFEDSISAVTATNKKNVTKKGANGHVL